MRRIILLFLLSLAISTGVVSFIEPFTLTPPRQTEKGSTTPKKDIGPAPLSSGETKATSEEAYRYLVQLPAMWAGTSSRDCKTYTESHIRELNPDFAIRLARMAKAWELETGAPLTILSAYRSNEEQKCACEGERGLCTGWKKIQRTEGTGLEKRSITEYVSTGEISNHTRRLAIDMRPGNGSPGDFIRLRLFLERYKEEFRLHMPYWSLGDRPHIEPVEVTPEKTRERNRIRPKRREKK